MTFSYPPILKNKEGIVRRVGFEIEFAEVSLDQVANSIIGLYGGTVEVYNKFYQKITGTSLGDFSLQIDARVLTEKSYEKIWNKTGLKPEELTDRRKNLNKNLENTLDSIASMVVPYEIGTPPVPIDELQKLEPLRYALFQMKAKGTSSSFLYAFATHINPELPRCDTETILRYTRAFLLLYFWLSEKSAVNITRKLTAFINPFPDEYISLVLNKSYNPDFEKFADDYYLYNPDRNRPLDLYPVLAFINKKKIESFQDLGKVSARPTFHYRVPNSLIDESSWTLAKEWNLWVMVEQLANMPSDLETLSQEYLQLRKDTVIRFKRKWITRIETWLDAKK